MRVRALAGLAAVLAVAGGCAPPSVKSAFSPIAAAGEFDASMQRAVREATSPPIEGARLIGGRWTVSDIAPHVTVPYGVDVPSADGGGLVAMAIADESALRAIRVSLESVSKGAFGAAAANGAELVDLTVTGTEHVLELANLDMAETYLAWRLAADRPAGAEAVQRRLDQVRARAAELRSLITVTKTQVVLDGSREQPAGVFAPIPGNDGAESRAALFAAAEELASVPAPARSEVGGAGHTVSASAIRGAVARLLTVANAGTPLSHRGATAE